MPQSMQFEITMRQIFGDKAYLIAGQFGNSEARNSWLRKALKRTLERINEIDTTSRHKRMLMIDTQDAIKAISKQVEPTWELVFSLMSLCFRFLGYDYLGYRTNTPIYSQSSDQRFTQALLEGGEDVFRGADQDAITIRARVCLDLKKQGIDTFTIALALNASEYHIKKIIRENA